MKTRRGFTLVELLTVIVIILILAGITMKLMALINQKTAVARASGDIERIKNALTEYHTINGCYPPAGKMRREKEGEIGEGSVRPSEGYGYSDGLTTYLFPDEGDAPWAKYLDGMLRTPNVYREGANPVGGKSVWSNKVHTIRDPWNNDYVYTSSPPFQAYLLYSVGPDGTAETADDVGGKWLE